MREALQYMLILAVRAKNLSGVPNPATARKIKSDFVNKARMAADPLLDLLAKKREMDSDFRRQQIMTKEPLNCGFIKDVVATPIGWLMFHLDQLTLYHKLCKKRMGCTLHIDASGQFVKDIKGEHRMLTYCIIAEVKLF